MDQGGGTCHSHQQMAGRSLPTPPSLDRCILESATPLQGDGRESVTDCHRSFHIGLLKGIEEIHTSKSWFLKQILRTNIHPFYLANSVRLREITSNADFSDKWRGKKYFHSISSIQFVWERAFRWQCTLQPIIMRPLQFEHTPFVCKLHSLITRGSMPEATSVHIMCNFPLLICPTYQCNFQPSDP